MIEHIWVAGTPTPRGAYSQMIRANGLVISSGIGPIDPATGQCVSGDIALQTRYVLKHIESMLQSQRLGLSDVVKVTAYLSELERDFQVFDRVYREYFAEQKLPARTTVGCGLRSMLVEIDFVAIG